jgi:hypothetical protein
MSRGTIAALIGAVAVILAALIGIIAQSRPIELAIQATQTAEAKYTPTSSPSSEQLTSPSPIPEVVTTASTQETPPNFVVLDWGPKSCAWKEPRVSYGGCQDHRDLDWLKTQFQRFKSTGVEGFSNLPEDFYFVTVSDNLLLNVTAIDGTPLNNVNIGWPLAGGLRLNDARGLEPLSPWLFIDENENWWRQSQNGTYQQVTR